MSVVDGKALSHLPQSDQYNDLFSSGIRNLILGFGFILISFLLLANSDTYFWLLTMLLGISLLASGISRMVKSYGIEANVNSMTHTNISPREPSSSFLPPSETEYIKPETSSMRTSELVEAPHSITDPTTKLLKIDTEPESTHPGDKFRSR